MEEPAAVSKGVERVKVELICDEEDNIERQLENVAMILG